MGAGCRKSREHHDKFLADENPDEPQEWQVGSRYELLKTLAVHCNPEPNSSQCGTLRKGSEVLLMGLHEWLQPADGDRKTFMAYIAETRELTWTSGWICLGTVGSTPAHLPSGDEFKGVDTTDAPLGLVRLQGSWELGGRYRVLDNLVLRRGAELGSKPLCEVKRHEEIIILEFGLLIAERSPRLRARVRSDYGIIGWVTMEVPRAPPLLDPLNLYSEAAATSASLFGGLPRALRRKHGFERMTVSGAKESGMWELGGKYRTLSKVWLRREVELDSSTFAPLRPGLLVVIQEIRSMQWHPSVEPSQELLVFIGVLGIIGWMSSTSSTGEAVLDVRDHLEYQKVVEAQSLAQQGHTEKITVQLKRLPGGCALGLAVHELNSRTLLVESLHEKGLVADWNASNPEQQLAPGDRITSVNGHSCDAQAMVAALQADTLEVIAERGLGELAHISAEVPKERSTDWNQEPSPMMSSREKDHTGGSDAGSSDSSGALGIKHGMRDKCSTADFGKEGRHRRQGRNKHARTFDAAKPDATTTCPAGHCLQDCMTASGICHRCRASFCATDKATGCESCEWFLCHRCKLGPEHHQPEETSSFHDAVPAAGTGEEPWRVGRPNDAENEDQSWKLRMGDKAQGTGCDDVVQTAEFLRDGIDDNFGCLYSFGREHRQTDAGPNESLDQTCVASLDEKVSEGECSPAAGSRPSRASGCSRPGRPSKAHSIVEEDKASRSPQQSPRQSRERQVDSAAGSKELESHRERPSGVKVEDVPDGKLFVDSARVDFEVDDGCPCKPCREDGFLTQLLACAPEGLSGQENNRLLQGISSLACMPYSPLCRQANTAPKAPARSTEMLATPWHTTPLQASPLQLLRTPDPPVQNAETTSRFALGFAAGQAIARESPTHSQAASRETSTPPSRPRSGT